jgi:hypothetical protein
VRGKGVLLALFPPPFQRVRRGGCDQLSGRDVGLSSAAILSLPELAQLDPIKFYIIRGNETFSGHLPVTMR